MKLHSMEESTDKIYARHRGMIRSLISSIVVNNSSVVDVKDLQQVGALALVVALKSYDPSQGSISGYIRKCVRNALLEQANSFSAVFTTDEKARRQANAIVRMRSEGSSDEDIMTRLGIKTPATFSSLLELATSHAVDLDKIEVASDISIEQGDINKMLDEIGLTEHEAEFVQLITSNHTMGQMVEHMGLSRSHLFTIKASIRDKILTWGQSN